MTPKKVLAGLLLIAIAASLAACGSSSSSSSSESSTAGGDTSGGDSGLVAESQKITEDALNGVVYSETNPTKTSEIEPYGTWRGPTSGPPPKKGATVEILICSGQAAACVETGEYSAKIMQELGWKTDTIDGRGTPEGFASAFDLAMSRNPDAILSVALPTAVVSAKLKEAHEKGIYLVSVADADKPEPGVFPYDAYVSTRQNVSAAVLGWAVIAGSEGKANVIQVNDPGFPVLLQSQEQFDKVLDTCSGCKYNITEWQITDASNASKVSSIIKAAVTQDPEAEYIKMPYSIGIPFVQQALRELGKSEQIQILSKDLANEGVQEVSEGTVLYDVGQPLEWLSYATVNEVVRGLGGAKALAIGEIGLGVSLFDKAKSPSNGEAAEWPGWPDFAGEYKKLWGVQ